LADFELYRVVVPKVVIRPHRDHQRLELAFGG
jgi:hypothetical protein